jgi:hypothetical protein
MHLINGLLKKDPMSRLSMTQIESHPWFHSDQESGREEDSIVECDPHVEKSHKYGHKEDFANDSIVNRRGGDVLHEEEEEQHSVPLPLRRKCSVVSEEGGSCELSGRLSQMSNSDINLHHHSSHIPIVDIIITDTSNQGNKGLIDLQVIPEDSQADLSSDSQDSTGKQEKDNHEEGAPNIPAVLSPTPPVSRCDKGSSPPTHDEVHPNKGSNPNASIIKLITQSKSCSDMLVNPPSQLLTVNHLKSSPSVNLDDSSRADSPKHNFPHSKLNSSSDRNQECCLLS